MVPYDEQYVKSSQQYSEGEKNWMIFKGIVGAGQQLLILIMWYTSKGNKNKVLTFLIYHPNF